MQSIISDPNIALLLVVVGGLGVYLEFCRPGLIAPGVLGCVCVLIGLASLGTSDPNIHIHWPMAVLLLLFALFTGFLLSIAARARRNKLKL